MNPHDIICELKKRGWTQRRLAAHLGCRPGAVWNVLFGQSVSRRIATHIAKVIGRPVTEVFPHIQPSEARARRAA